MFAFVIEPAQRHLTKHFASKFFQRFVTEYSDCEFSIRLADGTNLASTFRSPFTLVIKDPSVLEKILDSPDELTLGEAFISGDLDVEGDFQAALQFAELLMSLPPEFIKKIDLRLLGSALPIRKNAVATRDRQLTGEMHSVERDRAAIARRYDVSNEFYQLWLDPYMQYSAAYFASPEEDLNAAQIRRLDYLCQKLMLKPGEKLLDIGCGWGGLVLYAASHYNEEACGIADKAFAAGFNVLRLNQRNCGGTENLTPTLYESGLSRDYRAVLKELIEKDRLLEMSLRFSIRTMRPKRTARGIANVVVGVLETSI
jgi:cyclopropane-fatty-acyl-phospholipid synthase